MVVGPDRLQILIHHPGLDPRSGLRLLLSRIWPLSRRPFKYAMTPRDSPAHGAGSLLCGRRPLQGLPRHTRRLVRNFQSVIAALGFNKVTVFAAADDLPMFPSP